MATVVKMLLVLLCILQDSARSYAAPTLNAHDMIMGVNARTLEKRSVKGKPTAEDKILAENQAVGADLLEGDIMLSKQDKELFYGNGNQKRSGILNARSLWVTRVIPYVIQHTDNARQQILKAFETVKAKVPCLVFREKRSTDDYYLRFYQGTGCWSYIGRRTSVPNTDVSLGPGCLSQAVLVHEVMHALGFFHEQSRPDRDSFITIFYENINSGSKSNFERMTFVRATTQNTPYDYKSIMHYSKTTFTTNGKDTIRAKFDPSMNLGNTELSELDILELNKIYQCHVSTATKLSDWTAWTPCMPYPTSCQKIRQRFCISENRADCPGADSFGVVEETQACSSCQEPMNGHWNKWGSWGSCSETCNEGVRTRHRVCDNPVPANGGLQCPGSSSQTVVCRMKKCSQQWYDTSFEDGLGMWKQSTRDSGLNWVRHAGGTPSTGTGPEGDHTTHYGYYAYVEAGSLDHGRTAILESPELPAGFGDKCLSFFYNMNGKTMGKLIVRLRYKSGSTIQLWERSGHQGNYWNPAAVTLLDSTELYQIEIEGKIGYSPASDIAIDDVFIDNGKCTPGLETCKDLNTNCASWAKSGECHKNPLWMLRSCCSSCSGSMGSCTVDTYGATQCAGFTKDYGCTHNGEWMWTNCCKSCKSCLDSVGECSLWAQSGECDRNPLYMKENCKISCKVCKP